MAKNAEPPLVAPQATKLGWGLIFPRLESKRLPCSVWTAGISAGTKKLEMSSLGPVHSKKQNIQCGINLHVHFLCGAALAALLMCFVEKRFSWLLRGDYLNAYALRAQVGVRLSDREVYVQHTRDSKLDISWIFMVGLVNTVQ